MKEKICIVVSNVMTINAFLLEPIKKLSQHYNVYIIVNGVADHISGSLGDEVTVLYAPIERKINIIQDLKALFKLFVLFRKYRFQLVQSVTPKAGLIAMLAAFFARIPIRIHIFTGQVWVTRVGLGRKFLKGMDRAISMLATDLLVDSASQRQFLLDEGVVKACKSSFLAHGSISGVDITRFKQNEVIRKELRAQLAIKNNDIVFLFIGRLNRDKGVLDLASAFSNIVDRHIHLFIVGPDEAGMQQEMEKLLNDCIKQVHFIGFSSVPEAYMAVADVLCLPSYREGFGSVVIEAAAVGIPAIGSRIYGVEDAIVDGQSGLLFEAGNIADLKASMVTIIENETFKKLGSNARKRVLEQFTSEILASAWLDYYQARL